jgi:hypothetical protein
LSREPGVADSPKNSRRQFNPAPMAWPRPEAMPAPPLAPVRPEPGRRAAGGRRPLFPQLLLAGHGGVQHGDRDEELTRCG